MLIPRSLQCRIIAALLNGRLPEGYTLEQLERLYFTFDEPWRNYLGPLLDAMQVPDGVGRSSFIASYVKITPEHRELACQEAERTLHIPAMQELVLPEIEWLWQGWIPRGMLTLFGAMPSAGKSYVALDLARRVIAGTTFPDGTPVEERGKVIYVDAENTPHIINRRVTSWEVDRSQLFLMGPDQRRLMVDLTDAHDQDRLVEWTWAVRPALIVVDSLSSVSTRGENSVEDVRGIFIFLNRLALEYECGLLVIHHLRKPGAGFPPPRALTFHDLRGSSHITTMSRSVIGLHWVRTGPRADLNDPRRMDVLKTNLCRYPAGIGVTLQPMVEDPQVAEILYGAPPKPYQKPTRVDKCSRWLLEALEEHENLTPSEVVAMGTEAGFSRATLYRARQQLGPQVVVTHGKCRAEDQWALAKDREEGDLESEPRKDGERA